MLKCSTGKELKDNLIDRKSKEYGVSSSDRYVKVNKEHMIEVRKIRKKLIGLTGSEIQDTVHEQVIKTTRVNV
ncbi:Hypothetical protein CINCED_3A002494 [Cinara cedri]|uniref:Uncharacterized protein n=1 Tax=Cinara cedri TaxID=506608 RepID=A0A5E4N8K7_9HEMI|nr:Hypothetical protein CINCED_3A002494 [Cinara cedri]